MTEKNSVRLNMDFNKQVSILPDNQVWITSPADGVMRIPLEKKAAESGHTTSFVKFAPGSSFPAHQHPQGEEIYVLQGIFSDGNGDYLLVLIFVIHPAHNTHHLLVTDVHCL